MQLLGFIRPTLSHISPLSILKDQDAPSDRTLRAPATWSVSDHAAVDPKAENVPPGSLPALAGPGKASGRFRHFKGGVFPREL